MPPAVALADNNLNSIASSTRNRLLKSDKAQFLNSKQSVLGSQSERHAVTTASGYVAYESLSVLTYLRELLSDSNQMDKIVRSQPQILLARVGALRARVAFLRGLLRRAVEEQVRRTQALDEDRSSFQDFLTATVGDNADRNGPLYTKLQGAESKQSPLIRNFVYLDARSEGEEEQRMEQQYRAAEKSALLRLLLVYPAILSVEVRSGQGNTLSLSPSLISLIILIWAFVSVSCVNWTAVGCLRPMRPCCPSV